MSKLQETAPHEIWLVVGENERGSDISKLDFSSLSFENVQWSKTKFFNRDIKYIKASSELQIPKWVAEGLNECLKIKDGGIEEQFIIKKKMYPKLQVYFEAHRFLCSAYLNPITKSMVEVVEE